MLELLFVLLIAAVLGTMAFPRFSEYVKRRHLTNAQDAFGFAASRARASSVERGDVVLFWASADTDEVMVLGADGADTLMHVDMRPGRSDVRADLLLASGTTLTVCYVPRGFAHPGCGDISSDDTALRVGFANAVDTLWSEVNAVGQVEED